MMPRRSHRQHVDPLEVLLAALWAVFFTCAILATLMQAFTLLAV